MSENGGVSRDAFNALFQKVTALEARVNQLATEGTATQADAIRRAVADIPEVFTVTHYVKGADGKVGVGETEKLSMSHPSFYKLELIAAEVDALMRGVDADTQLLTETSISRFVLRLLDKQEMRNHFYTILQLIFDPRPDPDPSDLWVDVNLLKKLNPVEIIDALIKKSTPFFFQMLQILKLGKNAPSQATSI